MFETSMEEEEEEKYAGGFDENNQEAHEFQPKRYESPFYHLDIKVPSVCEICSKPAKTICSSCKGVYYCSRKCQSLHWPDHKSLCKFINGKLQLCTEEHDKLLNCDDMNFFEDPELSCSFWSFSETRPYCSALNELVFAYDRLNNALGRRESILLCMKYFKHCHGDNLSLRDVIVDVMIRSQLYQEAYDFIKWQLIGHEGNYHWQDITSPFLHYRYEDPSEPLLRPWKRSDSVNHWLGMTIIKYHVYDYFLTRQTILDTLLLGTHGLVGMHSPLRRLSGGQCQGLLDHILSYVFDDTLQQRCRHTRSVKVLHQQVMEHIAIVYEANEMVLPALLNPQKIMAFPHPRHVTLTQRHHPSEVRAAFEYCLRTWEAYPKLLAMIKEYLLRVRPQGIDYEIDVKKIHFW